MKRAIYLDDQPPFITNKINDVVAQCNLPPKAASVELTIAEPVPKRSFG